VVPDDFEGCMEDDGNDTGQMARQIAGLGVSLELKGQMLKSWERKIR
jgi:hypothetical protein